MLLLAEFERRTGFIGRLNGCIQDSRNPFLVRHTYKEMLTQRILQIASGYEDADDCDLLRDDSVLKLCAGKSPDSSPLSSQPTMSRLEIKMSIRELYNMGVCFVEEFINSYGDDEPECIILDCDDSNFNAYGNQQRFSTIITTNTATCPFSSSRGFRENYTPVATYRPP